MKPLFFFLFASLILFSCENTAVQNESVEEVPVVEASKPITYAELKDCEAVFEQYGVEGSFILSEIDGAEIQYCNRENIGKRFIPASTFKIFNALVALETGVIQDQNTFYKWDGEKRSFEKWNQDLDFQTAFKFSAVWYFQEMARQIGEERMQKWIDTVGYGNQDISGGIDMFWLDGAIRISPEEQVDFLTRLYQGTLPFSKRSMDIVKNIMVLEKTDAYILRGKTGWATREGTPDIGWFVGLLERDGKAYAFATQIEAESFTPEFAKTRIDITYDFLDQRGLRSVAD